MNDIVILRDIKVVQCSITSKYARLNLVQISQFNGRSCAVGFHDKLQWAVYKKETGEIDHNRGDAPLYEGLGPNGLGVRFSPFHNAQPQEIDYCSELSTWWNAILEKKQAALGTIHQIGEETPEHVVVPSTRRVHKLIRDADHKVLDGYFDCVVEVLHFPLFFQRKLCLQVSRCFLNLITEATTNSMLPTTRRMMKSFRCAQNSGLRLSPKPC